MKRILTTSLFFVLTFFAQTLLAQNPKPSETPPIEEDGDIVKINTSIIQMDVLVTDKDGKQIPNLKLEDFEIFENGKRQQIVGLSYVSVEPKKSTETKENKNNIPTDLDSATFPTTNNKPLTRGEVRRTVVLVVDDLSLSFTSFDKVRNSLKEFVEDQMQEGDLVAIIRTAGGSGSRQVFTSDKQALLGIIKKMKFTSIIGKTTGIEQIRDTATDFEGVSEVDEDTDTLSALDQDNTIINNQPAIPTGNVETVSTGVLKKNLFARGTLGTLQFVVNGLEKLPGRKAVMLFSDGFGISRRDSSGRLFYDNTITDYLERLSDLANRAGVVFYTIDARGLQAPAGIAQASDDFYRVNRAGALAVREDRFVDSQEGLVKLAADTGGRHLINSNSFNTGLQKMLDDQNGYYILAYEPNEDSFDAKKSKFNKIEVKVKRSDTKIRYRSGFFGVSDGVSVNTNLTPREQILDALKSPFTTADINLRLSPLFANSAQDGSFIRSLIHINSDDLTFVEDGADYKKASFDIVAVTYGDKGKAIDQSYQTYSFKIKNEEFQKIKEKGFVYNVFLPVKDPGAYQFRLVIRDNASGRLGSANQFLQIPNLKKSDLILSSIIVENYSPTEWQQYVSSKTNVTESKSSIFTDTAISKFKNQSYLRYNYEVYNAKLNNQGIPQLQTRIRIFKDGKEVVPSKSRKLKLDKPEDRERINVNGAVALGKDLTPGEYTMQILIYDELADKKIAVASQLLEFEIVE